MQTTAILVELLIVGGSLMLVIFPPLCALLGLDPATVANGLSLKDALIMAFVAYPLGIIWSRFCDWATKSIDRRIKRRYFLSPDDQGYHLALSKLLAADTPLADSMGQTRCSYRVARASVFTFLVAALVIVLQDTSVPELVDSRARNILVLALLLGSAASFWSWYHLRDSYLKFLQIDAVERGIVTPEGVRRAESSSGYVAK